jgi:hypothetical protein
MVRETPTIHVIVAFPALSGEPDGLVRRNHAHDPILPALKPKGDAFDQFAQACLEANIANLVAVVSLFRHDFLIDPMQRA